MSTAPNSYPSLCSSPPLPRTQTFSLITSQFNSGCGKQSVLIVRANTSEELATEEEDKHEEYEVEIEQPYGLKFAKGRDGGTYIDAIAPGGSADKTNMFSVGDRVIDL